MADVTMVVVDGVRYRPEDAPKGARKAEAEPVKGKAPRTPKTTARSKSSK